MDASWFRFLILLAICMAVIAALGRIELMFQLSRRSVAAPPAHPEPARGLFCYRPVWLWWIVVIFVTAFLGLFALRGARMYFDIRSDLRNQKSRVGGQEVEQLANDVLKRGATSPEPIPVIVPRETTENLPPAEPELAAPSGSAAAIDEDSLKVTIFEPGAEEGTRAKSLPDWTTQTGETDGVPRVIATTPFATASDAEAEALELLGRELAAAFSEDHPEADGWTPSVEAVRQLGVIGRRAIEESTLEVGEFAEPVFRSFVEIVPPNDLGAQLAAAWRADTVSSRLVLVGGVMGFLTLLFASLAASLRIDEATRGRYRKQLTGGTAAVWIAAAGLAMMIVESIWG